MNKDPHSRDRLLTAAFRDSSAEEGHLALAMAAALRIRRRRKARKVAAIAAITAALGCALHFAFRTPLSQQSPSRVPPKNGSLHASSAKNPTRRYEIISDEEMMTLLQGRPTLIIQEGGRAKRVIFLDQ
jgi:hypothetical protein